MGKVKFMSDIFNTPQQLNLFGETQEQAIKKSLNDKYLISPFSVFDTKQGYWMNRKKLWLSLGIKSELGRDANTFSMKNWADKKGGNKLPADVSIFDPVLCELSYKWFNIPKGEILDPFAGGSVRGIVARLLGYTYLGIDLSEKQIIANKENARQVLKDDYDEKLKWVNDDSMNMDLYIKDESVDMIFSCPPYFDLEVYSDKPNDLSNMEYDDFKKAYINIIEKACKKLKNDRFAVFVVGDIRDKDGFYRNFVDLTKYAFNRGGARCWNEIILLNSLASAPLRAATPFDVSRKLCKVHQNILVFYKGNPKHIKDNYPLIY